MEETYIQLELNLISAQDLKRMHLFGMKEMQTYCVVWTNPEKKLTTQIDRTGGANPTWNDKVIFRVEDRFMRSETSAVMVEIYCVGCLRDKLVGSVRVLLSNVLKGYGTTDFSGMSFSAQHVRRPSGRPPQGILNLGIMILDGVDVQRMNRFNPASSGAVDFRDLMKNPVQPRPSFVKKLLSIKRNNVFDAREQQARCQGFNNLAGKEEGRDQEKQKDVDDMKTKPVGYSSIPMAPKLKMNRVGLRNGSSKIHVSPSDSNLCAKGDQDPALDNQDEMVHVSPSHSISDSNLCAEGDQDPTLVNQGVMVEKEEKNQDPALVNQDEMVEKKEKKKSHGCYPILMAPRLKKNNVG